MVITSIEPQKKSGRFNIFVDQKFWCGLSENTVAKFMLFPKKIVDTRLLDEIFKFEIFNKSLDGAIAKIGRRPHSQKEIELYIVQKFWKNKDRWFENTSYQKDFESIRDETIAKVVDKLRDYKYLDDNEFTKWWIESRKRSRPKGWIAIKSELVSKGISEDIIREYEISENDEVKICQKYYDKVTRIKKLSREKLISRMSSRGFSWDTIQTILEKNEVETI